MVIKKEHIAEDLRSLTTAIAELHADPANARKHNPRNIDTIKASLAKFGQRKPIVVQRDGMVVRAGNGTLEAARALGWSHVAAVVLDDDNTTASAYAIADNRTAELAEWDDDALADMLKGLQADGWDLDGDLGFSEDEVSDMLPQPSADDVVEDEVPEPPDDPVTQPGDLIILGDHRLLCGDCLAPGNAEALLDGGIPAMAFTDPPYNVSYNDQETPRDERGRPLWGTRTSSIANDSMGAEEWLAFTQQIATLLKETVVGCVYVCHAPGPDGRVMGAALDEAMHWSASIVWAKDRMVFGRASYQRRHEVIWFGWPDGAQRTFTDDRTITDVWEFPKPKRSDLHPTMKPIALVAQAIQHASRREQIVFDPFLGSGTTLIAAEQMGRACYGTELEPAYCDVIVQRWENLTGKRADLRPADSGHATTPFGSSHRSTAQSGGPKSKATRTARRES